MKITCTKCQACFQQETVLTLCPLCEGNLKIELQGDSRYALALAEGRCYICGTHSGESIKIPSGIFHIEIKSVGLIPMCNLCSVHTPVGYESMASEHIMWEILKKRLNQLQVFSKTCERCGTPMTTARKEKKFCSDRCRAAHWINAHKLQS